MSALSILLKIDHAEDGQHATVAGLRVDRLALGGIAVNIGSEEAKAAARHAVACGCRLSLSGNGVFKDNQSDALIRSLFFAGTVRRWLMVVPDLGALTAPCQIVALEFAADHAGEVTFHMSIESVGDVSFEAAS